MKSPVTLIKGDDIGIETDYRDALPVNMFAVKKNVLSAQGYLLMQDGIDLFAEGSGIDRGAVYNERFGTQYRVSGEKLISVEMDGTVSELGSIPGNLQSRLEDFYSFNTQGVIADNNFYLYDPIGGFRSVTDPDLGEPIDGIWVDGYYFMTDGEYLFHTDIADEEAIDPLKFATAEFMPDPSLGLAKTQDNKVLVFGRYSLEYFVNDSSTNFAFVRIPTRAQKIGIVATHAKCETKSGFCIVGGRKQESVSVHIIQVGSSEKIATREVDKLIGKYTEPELADIRVETREDKAVSFILIHLPEETLCYNQSVAETFGKEVAWSLLRSGNKIENNYRAINFVFDARTSLWACGDKFSGKIGQLNELITTHYDDLVEWELFSPFIRLEKLSIDSLEIQTIPGFTDFKDGTVALSLTYDGIFYGTEIWMEYGEKQNYNQRFIQRMLGYVPDWVGIKFRGSSKTKMAFGLLEVTYS